MLDIITKEKQNIIVIGDVFVSCETMEEAIRSSSIAVNRIDKVFWGEHDIQSFSRRQVNIEKNGPEAEPYPSGLDELIEDADIIMMHFAPLHASLIKRAKHLKVILTCRGGVEQINIEAVNDRNIPVINVIRNAEPVADFTLGLIIAMTRNIATSHKLMMEGIWTKKYPNYEFTTTLSNLKVGLAGLGNVGIEIAKRLKALHIQTFGYDEYLSVERLKNNGLESVCILDTLEDLFSECDVISVHLRLCDETRRMIDTRYFSRMKPGSYFINTSRGGLVNQNDLIHTLKEHRIAGAALDVFESEPLEKDSGLQELDNIILTPHIAGDTVSAVPKSPFLLMREVDALLQSGNKERIVNARHIDVDLL